MFKRNLVIQEDYKDCGPACLAMIIKHYKGNVNIFKLKELCKTNKNGTNAYNLIEASKKCGFEAYGIRCNVNEFNKNMILPCIAHVVIDNSYTHYVVIYKVDNKVHVKDPIGKIKKYSFEEFEKIYSNILIVLYPKYNILYEKDVSIYNFIKEIVKISKSQLIFLILLSFIITIFSIMTTFYFQYMIDNIQTDKNKLILISIVFGLIYLFKIISNYIRNQLLILIDQKTDLYLTCDTFKRVIHLPYPYFHNHTTGEIVSKITDLKVVKDVISNVSVSLFIDLPLTIIALLILYFISPKLTLIAIIMFILYILLILLFKKPYEENINELKNLNSFTTSYMVEGINNFETIKGNNMEEKINFKMEQNYVTLSNKMANFERLYNFQSFIKELINDGGFLIIILIGSVLTMNNTLSIGKLISYNTLLTYFLSPVLKVISLDNNLKEAKSSIKRVLNLTCEDKNKGIIDKPIKGNIEIKNLNFSYDIEVLKNINLDIKKGNKVLILGNSGGGKSTLLKILKHYYEVKRGSVLIGGIDINDYKKNDIIYISQNEKLFTDTIYNNIGNSDKFSEIIKICLLDEVVEKFKLGYNTLIEEDGFNISGGQKQRIMLARAINNDFNILLIDEGLNQLDVNSERKILKNLFNHYKDKTIIVVSHRLDNMDLYNQVIEISKKVIRNESFNN